MNDHEVTRMRLLMAATEVFAEHGYHAATTREICRRANANLAAIHYHFGDKAELYREVFRLPFLDQSTIFGGAEQENLSLEQSLSLFYRTLMTSIGGDDLLMQRFMRLHAREEADPSGVLGDVVSQAIRPGHEHLKKLLGREFDVTESDLEIERLAFCMVGMAVVFFHGKCIVNAFSPELLQGEQAVDTMIEKLTLFAKSLVESERIRRSKAKVGLIPSRYSGKTK